jgi:protein involved in polysaccharide export with SLBB domain
MRTLLLLALGLAACASTDRQYLVLQARTHDQTLAPGDTVTLVEAGAPIASGTVAADGSLELPGATAFAAAGMNRRQLRAHLGAPSSVQIETAAPPSGRVFVFGRVARPGRYPMGAVPTLLDLVQAAEPHPDFADLMKVRVLRTVGEETRESSFNVLNIQRGATNPMLRDGDIVFVDKSPLGQAVAPLGGTSEAPSVRADGQ